MKREPAEDCHEPSPAEQDLLADHGGLPALSMMPYEAPRNRLEHLLAELWQQVLCIGRIGIHDSFFELGGDSVTAAIFLNELKHRLGEAVYVVAMFEVPTIAGLADYLNSHHAEAVSRICSDENAQRTEKAAKRIDATKVEVIGGEAPKYTPIQPVLRDGCMELPLSFGQQRLWFLDQLQPGNPAYNLVQAIRIEGALDVAALRSTLEAIVARHASLRTTFRTVDGNPIQVVKPRANVTLSLGDLSAPTKQEREAAALRLAEQEAQRPFDLERGPLLRTTLLRLTEADHLLVLTIHHIVVDGWSMGVLIQELLSLYPSFAAGEPPTLSELPIQYADFAFWERQWLQGAPLEKLLSYWKRELSGRPASLQLPTDHPRPALESLRGATRSFVLPKTLSNALIALGLRENATLFMTLLAAFQVLLYRYTSQTDILVGTPVANRTRREIEQLIGFFVNTLVLRADLTGDPSFRELLVRVREVALQAYAHQDLPFEKLVEELQPERDLSRNPLFQVMFILQNAPMPKLELGKLRASLVEVETGTAKFDLTLSMQQTEQGLRGKIEYSRDLFDAETMTRMVGHWQTLLEGIVADPGQRLSELPLLTAAERQQLVVEWNDTRAEYPREQCIHQLLEEQVERTPQAVAVVYEDQQLTYGELNRRGNQLGHFLRKLGVGPEVRVGLCVERSLEMIVGLVGILKAGGAYVPLDPAYPRERLAFMLEDAQVSVLVTSKTLSDWLPKDERLAISIDTQWESVSQERAENPVPTAGPDSLAYVIYTSGSTGRPKGVLVDHRNLVHSTRARIDYYQDRSIHFLLLSSFAFDSSLAGIFWTLSQGGTLVLPRPGLERGPSQLAELIAQKQISHVLSLPSLYGLLLEEANQDELRSLCSVIVAGEACSREVIALHSAKLPLTTIFNEYGPTESTVWSSVHMWRGPVSMEQVPIGRPIANTQIYILDECLQPVPIGVLGELHIGGAGLARGYLNRPEVTAEKFIPNPFAETPGERLYRTGDRARYLADGSIEFLGRRDEQVKIRGFRVELGEIEAVLNEHPAVRETVVVARNGVGDKRLVAYVVPKEEPAPAASELRRWLKEKLPEYMVPSAFVSLAALPLLANGKVDRNTLPPPDRAGSGSQAAFVEPRSAVEEMLAGIWKEILGIERVGIYDNFFELGGHSLLAIQLVSRLCQAFAVDLPLRRAFEAPTVAGLAECVETTLRRAQPMQVPPIKSFGQSGATPLSFAQQRLLVLDLLDPEKPTYNIPARFLLRGQLDIPALERSLNSIIERHEVLRTSFRTLDGEPAQVISTNLSLALPLIDLTRLSVTERESEIRRLATQQARSAFDLDRVPLLRTTLLRLDDTEHILLLTMHHIISDEWSMGVLMRELEALYDAFSSGRPSPLRELPIQYADYSRWQRQVLQGEVLAGHLSYWKKKLEAAPGVLDLPTDHPRPAVRTFRGGTQSFVLPVTLSNELRKLSLRENATLFMTLLAAFQVLLYRYTSQTDILVGTPVANRTRREIEQLIGFFVNTLVLRADLTGDPSFRELLVRVREVALQAYAHQDLPFEKLVEELQPERDLSRNPLFQVMFILQNAPMPKLELGKLRASLVEVETGTAKFDLTLSMQQTEQGLRGKIEYSRDLFDAETMTRMVGHWQTLLEGIVADPGQRLSELPLLTAAERQQLVVEWNDTRAEYPREQCIHQLLEEQVERTPQAVAVVYEDQQLTYGELNRRGNQLGHFLRKLGVGPEVRVGLCVERSLEMIVGLVGILKAGGAYVPLDPAYPRERLAFMLADAGVEILLTQRRLIKQLPEVFETICLEDLQERTHSEDSKNLATGVGPDNLAYVMYTSGSAGKPKGVEIAHRGVVRLLFGVDFARFDETDVFLQLAPVSFDASNLEIWGPLLHGAQCILFPNKGPTTEDFGLALRKGKVSTLWLTASLFNTLVEEEPEVFSNVQQLLVGGEALSPVHVRRGLQLLPHTQLVNGYGPTENTTFTCCYPIPRSLDGSVSSVPIGRPIANTQVYILDQHLQPVPIKVAGELHVAGHGLARGYLNQPELTAEKFVPNPFSSTPGARLYKTGDLACYMPDGTVEFLGRLDDQIKIRGFRVELGDVEAVLAEHPGVKTAAVTVREDSPGEKRLIAFVTLRPGFAPTVEELLTFLKRKLPEYMLPWKLEITDGLPLTPSGKVDRRKLLVLSRGGPSPKEYSAPRTILEEKLVKIWSNVLKLERVGVRDNFFDLGGHSLLAVKLIAKVEKHTGKKLSLADVFQAPTIQEQAAVISASSSQEIPGVIPIQPRGLGAPFFCVGAGPLFRPLALRLGTEHPFLGLGLVESEILGLSAPFKLEDIASHLVPKLRDLQPEGPYCLGGWCDDGILAYEVAQQLEAAGQRALLVLFDAWNPALWRNHSGGEAFRVRFHHLFRRLGYHLSSLRGLPLRKQWEYLGETWNTQKMISGNRLWRTRYKVLLRTKGTVPSRPSDFNKIEFVAVRNYEPKPFPGSMVLFQSDNGDPGGDHDSAMGWRDLVSSGLEIYKVPGSHRGMFAEPNVEVLARVLRTRLWEAQAMNRAS